MHLLEISFQKIQVCFTITNRIFINAFTEFFYKVGQFAVQFHVSRTWVNSIAAILNIGKLYMLLEAAGLHLMYANIGECHPYHEASGMIHEHGLSLINCTLGCHPKLLELGYPCGSKKMCQNMLFARV